MGTETEVAIALKPLPYHEALRDYLKEEEPAVWHWYASNKVRGEQAETVRFDLLKSTYRVERESQPGLYATAEEVAKRLGLDVPITLYQAQNPHGLNASLAYVPGEAHIVLHGPVSAKLTAAEFRALLGHELCHFLLWRSWEGEYMVAEQILAALTHDPAADACHFASARLVSLYNEVFCDRGSLLIAGDPLVVIATLLKVETQLDEVNPESYLRQAEEIFGRGAAKTEGLSHPEAFIRARAVKLWADGDHEADRKIQEMLEGRAALNNLDLLAQRRVAGLTRRVLDVLLSYGWMQTEPVLAHARLFFEDFVPPDDPPGDAALAEDLRTDDPAMQDYYGYLLLDFVTADRDLEELPLAAALSLAEQLGLKDRFVEIAKRELRLRKKQLETIDEEKDTLLAKAHERACIAMNNFHEHLRSRLETGGFSTEDALAAFLPLVREVLETHAAGRVAPLEGLDVLRVEGARIWFEQAARQAPRENAAGLRRVETAGPLAVTIVAESRRTTEVDEGGGQVMDLSIGDRAAEVKRPVYLPGYVTWEHQLGHHDPLTDIFSLGMILASLACGLDLADPEQLRTFVGHRRNLFAIHSGLHPVLAQAIVRMTEIDRHRRVQDLRSLLHNLEHYRDQEVDIDIDLARTAGFTENDNCSKQRVVLGKLRERLFEISKRNRLLHFHATMQTVNLTHASVPLSFDIANIRPDQILVWNKPLHDALTSGEPISLNKYLNFAEALYLPSMLDRIIAESRRDHAEFGFGQLRLVICFLYWANVKERPVERFDSPLVLLPVTLKKKKGIRDTYYLETVSPEAEVNPVIRYQFKQLYDIDLPETIDLAATTLDQFFDFLSQKIAASEPAVALNKVDRPRIELIHDKARRKLDQYRRRARLAGRGIRSFQDLDYSYDQANYHPLGITLFSTKVRPPATHLRTLIEERPRPRSFATAEPEPSVVEKERVLYQVKEGGEENPYVWNFDLCSVTLGNFKYRKMSLVRDYETLLAHSPANPAFDAVFSLAPRLAERQLPPALPLEERFHVVSSDPTQASAIEEARAGRSYIIQGPPGTGKSQTITNLIADYAARGKRVLFVCEKRAAIDVVYARLRQCGVGDLCCLIHDSQIDKKAFVMDLKQTYETLLDAAAIPLAADGPASAKNGSRKEILTRLQKELQPLEQFDAAMQGAPQHVGIPLRQLLRRGIELRNELPELSPLERERLPDYAAWWRNRERIDALSTTVHDIRGDGILARHPLRLLSPRLTQADRPLKLITAVLATGNMQFTAIEATLGQCGVPRDQWQTPAAARALVDYAKEFAPLARIGRMDLFDPETDVAKQFAEAQKRFRRQRKALTEAEAANAAWRTKLPAAEVPAALEQSRSFEQSFFAWLRPGWWRLRRILNSSYDFRAHVVHPRWSQVLAALQKEYEERDKLDQLRKKIAAQFKFDEDVDGLVTRVQRLGKLIPSLPDWLGKIHGSLLKSAESPRIIGKIAEADVPLRSLAEELEKIMQPAQESALEPSLDELRAELKGIEAALGDLPAFLQCLKEVAELPPALGESFRTLSLTPAQIEAATADRSVTDAFRQQRQLAQFNGGTRDRHAARLERLYGQWLAGNAGELRSRVAGRFLENVRTSGLPAAQLHDKEKDFKKQYSRGRRELEHEFGKSMRFKSIRDLVAGDSGAVIKDLKPVWLMSPLSVSDTLPMDAGYFDVVIFDEASQITLEEAVPSVFRAPQAIVVGDEMQLPPTDFFSARQTGEEEEDLVVEEAGEVVHYDLASNSFLNHAAKNLPSTMLGWHYRSRSESLVSFSNWAFYDGRLLTVPEERLAEPGRKPISVADSSAGEQGAAELLRRSISFHQIDRGLYDKRRNRAEADYIARLVRELLRGECGRSIGIVAFSEAQQGEIEGALERLAQDDSEFRDQLDAEREREVEGQFVGLLVKNLENTAIPGTNFADGL